MKLIDPFYEIISDINGDDALESVEESARTSTLSFNEMNGGQYNERLIKILISKGHYTPFEFYDITIRTTSSRAVLDEWRTHRVGSYVMSSTRYCNFLKERFHKEVTFCKPEYVDDTADNEWALAMIRAEQSYFYLLQKGWKTEQARGVLPLDVASTMTIKYNLRQWREFFKLRTHKSTHSEFRRITIPLLNEFKEKIPLVFDDINPVNHL